MTLTASFQPQRLSAAPGETVSFALRIDNGNDEVEEITLSADGALGDAVSLGSASVRVDGGGHAVVETGVAVPEACAAGEHTFRILAKGEALGDEGTSAMAAVEVTSRRDHEVRLDPVRSRSGSAGKHRLVVENRGNVAVTIDITTEVLGGGVTMEPDAGSITVAPFSTSAAQLTVVPDETFRRGDPQEHPFRVHVTDDEGATDELDGTFEQVGRIRPWHVVLASVLGGLILLLLLWFVVLEPLIRGIAEEEADAAIAADRAALQLRIAELEEAAAEASELPLGRPVDVRLAVEPAPGETVTDSVAIEEGRVVSITDVVLQNPTGAIGSVIVRRDDTVLLQSELANFRDLDFHFVAPYTFAADATIVLEVTCGAAGPSFATCPVGASFVGFDDEG